MVWRHHQLLCRILAALAALALVSAAESPTRTSLQPIQQTFTVENNYTYRFNIEVGSPQQMVTVMLDFGSADLILFAGNSPCMGDACSVTDVYTDYNYNLSKSFKKTNRFSSSVLNSDGRKYPVVWCRDTISMAGLTLNNTIIALDVVAGVLSRYHDESMGILGIGPRGLELTVQGLFQGKPMPTYDNVMHSIPGLPPSYSIWVNPDAESEGIITFGGIDETQYIPGTLELLPIRNSYPVPIMDSDATWDSDYPTSLYLGVEVDSLSLNLRNVTNRWINQTLTEDVELVAVLDSRLDFSMPMNLLTAIGRILQGRWSGRLAMYVVSCATRGELVLSMSGFPFIVPMSDLLKPLGTVDENSQPLCALRIGLADQMYLSNRVLKNYFMAVDYTTNEIAFGQPARAGEVPVSTADGSSSQGFEIVNGSVPHAYRSFYSSDFFGDDISYTVNSVSGIEAALSFDGAMTTSLLLEPTPQATSQTAFRLVSGSRKIPKASEASNAAVDPQSQAVGSALSTALAAVLSAVMYLI